MAQSTDILTSNRDYPMLCYYLNPTSRIQISRIANIPNWYFERAVFPGQRLLFEAPPDAQMEIYVGMMGSAILSDKIPCTNLRVNEGIRV